MCVEGAPKRPRKSLAARPVGSQPLSNSEMVGRRAGGTRYADVGTRVSAGNEPKAIPGTFVQYPDLQGGGALGDATIPGTRAGSIAASARGSTYSNVGVAGGARGGETGAAAATAAGVAHRRRAMPKGGAVTPPRRTPAHGGRGSRNGVRTGGWDRPRATRRL